LFVEITDPFLAEYQSMLPHKVEAPTVAESPKQIVAFVFVKTEGALAAVMLMAVLPLPQTPFQDST